MDARVNELVCLGIPENIAVMQAELLDKGSRHANVIRSAAIGDGVITLPADLVTETVGLYENREPDVKVLKFVPASGAATRMFKELIAFTDSGLASNAVNHFFEKLSEIPFYDKIDPSSDIFTLARQIVSRDKLGLAFLPKGIIPFHRYENEVRTAFEEHLVEGVSYAMSDGKVHIHFTISPEHMERVTSDMNVWIKKYGERMSCEFDLSFSIQRATTDTMAICSTGEVLRTSDGRLRLRPGGHGSLIHNLNELDADIIFIKNIDNVVNDKHRADTVLYKKALGGLLIKIRKEARELISILKAGNGHDEAASFLLRMGVKVPASVGMDVLIKLMNRPYRVCGMVRNEGEPGGGPFWVKKQGRETLQIVESAEIDLSTDANRAMLDQGTHFNPVDLVCCLNDLYGQRKNLLDHVDMDAAFVTDKIVDGQPVKVLEWPGLWNGAMSDWNSLFVEVPVSTFNPVKTVNDLLRPMHQ